MERKDFILLVVGGLFGFFFSLLGTWYQNWDQSRKSKAIAKKLLVLELQEVEGFVESTCRAFDMAQVNPKIPRAISLIEIDNFKMVMQSDLLASLETSNRESVFKIYNMLIKAEALRVQAVPLLNVKDKEPQLNYFGVLYSDHLQEARKEIKVLMADLGLKSKFE